MKPGTPAGMQLEPAVNATLPASTSSLSFFMRSFTHGFRFGLPRSAIRYAGWPPTPLGTKGCAGSWVTGGGRPGTGSKKGPPPLSPTHPALSDEKSGGAAFCCATACAIGGAATTPTRMLPASSFSLKVNEDIVASPTVARCCHSTVAVGPVSTIRRSRVPRQNDTLFAPTWERPRAGKRGRDCGAGVMLQCLVDREGEAIFAA